MGMYMETELRGGECLYRSSGLRLVLLNNLADCQ